jgi:heavy metal sensor kinase
MLTKSIKWRLLLWMAFLLTFILTGLGIAIYEIHLASQLGQFDDRLRRRVAMMSAALYAPGAGIDNRSPGPPGDNAGPPPMPPDEFSGGPPDQNPPPRDKPALNFEQLPADVARLFENTNTTSFYFVLWLRDATTPFKQSANTPAGVTRPPPGEKDSGTYVRMHDEFREAYHATERGDCVLVGRIVTPEWDEARQFGRMLFLGGLGILAFVMAGAWWLIVRALRPVEKISAAALKISSGDLSHRISAAETESELGQLTAVLNSTFARLEAAFAQQKQFTADASHELRTPLTVMISEAQLALSRERSPEDYREALAACLDTAQKMRGLTGALLELARLDAGQEFLHREKTDLAAVAGDCVKLIRPLAVTRHLQIHSDLAPAETVCDETHIAQVVSNLLTNAINYYNKDGGEIRVVTRRKNGAAVLTVADTGQGIAARDLPRVFERFYRADKSRTGGNTGLGLAISKAIVEAHGGTIEVSSLENVGTTFTVILPKVAKAS